MEGRRPHPDHLPEPGVWSEDPAAYRVPLLRYLQGPPGRFRRLTPRPLTAGKDEPGEPGDHSGLLAALGVEVAPELLRLALTHRSYAYENGGLPTNERLEFLGDSVLGLSITERLYHEHPEKSEGELAKLRASVVNMHALAEVARNLGEGGLGAHLLLGKGEELTGGRDKPSILADGMESLLGAVHLEHGIDVAREVVLRLFADLLERGPRMGAGLDFKTSLQELTAERGLGVPSYEITSTGPDHDKEFTATTVIAGDAYGQGVGRSKKEAEQKAAGAAYRALTGES